jgi:hypothetical protein
MGSTPSFKKNHPSHLNWERKVSEAKKKRERGTEKEEKAYLKGSSILPLFFVSIINYIINNITYLW